MSGVEVMERFIDVADDVAVELAGVEDRALRALERRLGVVVDLRGNRVRLAGDADRVAAAADVIAEVGRTVAGGHSVGAEGIDALASAASESLPVEGLLGDVVWRHRKGVITPRTPGQKGYVAAIRSNTITFGIGPAGTGKTYLAVALAAAALSRREVGRIVLSRPAVEAGERLGFLPGDLAAKVDPYLRPLYDALGDMFDPDRIETLFDRDQIEVAPLAFMRGRTLNDSFIILDEAQNTTEEQMKMFLTRLGQGSRMVVTGDITQIDLPVDRRSGLVVVEKVLEGVEDVAFCRLGKRDVVRHPLVQRIVEAYAAAPR